VAQIPAIVLVFAAGVAEFAPIVTDFAPIVTDFARVASAAIMANFGTFLAKVRPITAHFGALPQNFGTLVANVRRGLCLRHAGDERCRGKRRKKILSHRSWLLWKLRLAALAPIWPSSTEPIRNRPFTNWPSVSLFRDKSVICTRWSQRRATTVQRGCANRRAWGRFRPRLSCA